jgi:hypothetical protein
MNMMFAVEIESLPNADDDEIYRAVLYVLCDENRKPVPAIVITGVAGDLGTSSNRTPFIILKDGRGDYGSDFEDPADRFFETNLRSKTIKSQELFTVWWATAEQRARQIETSFRINKTTLLAGPSL